MNLYTSASSIESHRTRIVLNEKDIVHEVNIVDPKKLPEDLIDLNPYGSLPTLVDRDLVLYNSRVIMEYLEERFPIWCYITLALSWSIWKNVSRIRR